VRAGWTLIADDLARVIPTNPGWSVPPGLRQSKIHEAVVTPLGLDSAALRRRWTPIGSHPIPDEGNKLVFRHPEYTAGPVPLTAIYGLARRRADLTAPLIALLPPQERLSLLLSNLSRDAACPSAPPAPAARHTVLEMLGTVPVLSLTMPDDLIRLPTTAAQFASAA
jgi:hypothetical protein